ncbi:MAG TPA: CBS domain-containing protein, partial [Blastocatellia bacterium]|nr:CBS domain-containing protein [Blastocatellia bacterium]
MPKTVQDIIKNRKEVYSISNQTTVAEAARYLKDRGIRAAGVRNVSGKIVGVVSQSDISDKVVAENYR